MQEGMLVRFAAAMQRGQIQGIGGQGPGGGGATVVVDDNCTVSSLHDQPCKNETYRSPRSCS